MEASPVEGQGQNIRKGEKGKAKKKIIKSLKM